jgi:integrase
MSLYYYLRQFCMAVRFRHDRNKWFAQVTTVDGRLSRSFDTELEATEWEATIKAERVNQRQVDAQKVATPVEGSLGQLVRLCGQLDWAGKDPSQHENAVRLVRLLGPSTHAAELTMQRLDQLVVELRATGIGNTTIRKYLNAASVMLKRACRMGYIQAMPLFPEGRTLKRPEPRDLVIPDDWFAALLDAMERREQRLSISLTLFLRQMGCRVGEALDLTWDRVDLTNRKLQFIKTKGSAPRRLPINDEVLALLKAMQARQTQRVFPIEYATYLLHYTEAKHRVCDELGLGEVVRKEWVVHTLRHTRITELAGMGWQAPAIQQWAGHKSLSVTQRYIHGAGINLEELVQC